MTRAGAAEASGVPRLAASYRGLLEARGFQVEAAASDAHALVVSRGPTWALIALVADGPDAIASVTPL